ncbi:MAG: hypothetical protein SGARI_004968, partial [Bacillariaceae sp.]
MFASYSSSSIAAATPAFVTPPVAMNRVRMAPQMPSSLSAECCDNGTCGKKRQTTLALDDIVFEEEKKMEDEPLSCGFSGDHRHDESERTSQEEGEEIAMDRTKGSITADLLHYNHHEQQPSSIHRLPEACSSTQELEAWSKVSKKIFKAKHGLELKLEWQVTAPPNNIATSMSWQSTEVARKISYKIDSWFQKGALYGPQAKQAASDSSLRQADLARTIHAFSTFCTRHFASHSIKGYKIKLAVMHGSSATRCPAYHVDHVPVRCIKTMLGPGTVYLDCDTQQYNDSIQSVARNECPAELMPRHYGAPELKEDEDFNERLHWKEVLVEQQAKEADGILPSYAATGQAVFFTGGTWANFAGDERAGV